MSKAFTRGSANVLPRVVRAWVIVAITALAALPACAMAPRLDVPKVTVVSVSADRITGTQAFFTVTLAIANPNDREVSVAAAEANLTIEGTPVGMATLAAPMTLPAKGEVTATLNAQANWDAALRIAGELAARARAPGAPGPIPPVRYTVSGVAVLEGGLPIPFNRSGEFRMGGGRTEIR
ncbi:MAG: LEA type 2 family protein [Betaproteobacteria bacterium]|nr:LEA type 2 family protein [Betaproteobacteria bacterium]